MDSIDGYEEDLLRCVSAASRQADELREENTRLLNYISDREDEVSKMFAKLSQLEQRADFLESELAKVADERERFISEIADLKRENSELKREVEEKKENISEPVKRDMQRLIIDEETLDELEPPMTPTSRAFPRQSIGQWSVERIRNNMSVKSMVNSMERRKL